MKIPLLLQNNFKAECIKIFEERGGIISLHQDVGYEIQMDGQGNPLTVPLPRQILGEKGEAEGIWPTPQSPRNTPDSWAEHHCTEAPSRTSLTWADWHSPPSPVYSQHAHARAHTWTCPGPFLLTGAFLGHHSIQGEGWMAI